MAETVDRLAEQVWVLRAQAGDAAAWSELISSREPSLRYYLRKMLGDDHRAEDVLQEVWIDIIRGLPGLRVPAAFPTWVYRIARDRLNRHLRGHRPEHQLPDEQSVLAPGNEEHFRPDEAERVHNALDALPAEQREVLVLRFLEDLSYEDIARVVGCQLGTVRSRLHYGKQALRKIFTREDRVT